MNEIEYFKYNKKKAKLIVEKGRKVIYKSEFANCNYSCILIPNSVEIIEEEAFINSTNLVYVYFEKNSKLTTIKEQAFFNCSILENFEFPKSLKRIEFNAFGATILSNNIIEYKGAKYIGSYTNPYLMLFESCYKEKMVRFHSKTKYILNSAFLEDDILESIVLNKSLVQIGEYAFEDCKNLKTIKLKKGIKLEIVLEDAFKKCNKLSRLLIGDEEFKVNNENIIKDIKKHV